ncbi:MAG: hypothetical protein RJA53_4 [Bacteroidota bacterium]|jgi:hypothetical protein
MEKRSQLDAFEEFILDEVNEHRMYPSGRVWENIRTEVHGKRSWPALTIISLSILVALTVSTFIVTQKSTPIVKSLIVHHSSAPVTATTPTIEQQIKKTRKQFSKAVIQVHKVVPEMPTQENLETTGAAFSTTNNEVNDELQTSIEAAATIATCDSQTKINNPSLLPALIQQQVNNNFDLSSTANNKQKNRKYSVQFYATPSASFRVLSDQKVKELIQPSLIAIPLTAPISQTPTFNQAVRHRPDIGLELGLTFNYPVSNKLQFKTGLQVNIRQYQIDTYETGANAATLALVNGGRIQTISVLSSYNNNVGFRSAQLNNKVYQIAMPIGLDYQVLKFKKFGIHTQATIQPTYNINKNVYLLSTDYANYAAGNDYVRKWNINTSVGIQFSYQKGNTIWQLGPQIRYQTLPTYNNPYPIKENLIDYGFRIGWSKQFK